MKFQVLPLVRVNLNPANGLESTAGYNRYILSTLLSLEEDRPEGEQIPLAQLAVMNLADYLDQRLTSEDKPPIGVLIFDQFEEILTLDPTDLQSKQEFFSQLGDALGASNRWALFSRREDYVAALDP